MTWDFDGAMQASVERVRHWYASKMEYRLPDISFVDVRDDELGGLNEYTRNLVFMANTLPYYRDLEAKAWIEMIDKRLQERFGRRITEQERDAVTSRVVSQLDSSTLPHSGSYPYNTIFVFPRSRREIQNLPDPIDCMEYTLSHEAFHLVQYERGFAGRYPHASEPTAIVISMSYDWNKGLFRKINTGTHAFETEMEQGVFVATNVLHQAFGVDPNPTKLLSAVKLLLDESCYRTINYYIFQRVLEASIIRE